MHIVKHDLLQLESNKGGRRSLLRMEEAAEGGLRRNRCGYREWVRKEEMGFSKGKIGNEVGLINVHVAINGKCVFLSL